MKQNGDSSNNVQIGRVGKGSTINVEQYFSMPNYTLLEIAEESIKTFDKETLVKDRNIGLAKFLGGAVLGGLGYLSDAIGISSHFGFSLWWMFPVGALAGLLLATPNMRYTYMLLKLPRQRSEAAFIGDNEVVHENEKGKIITYQRSAPCIYPNCSGKITLTEAPEREKARLGRDFVGICSLAGRDHSYRIDYVWNAYPELFDWQPVDPTTVFGCRS